MVKSYRESINDYKDVRSQLVADEIQHRGKKDREIKVEFSWLKDWSGNFKPESDLIWHTWKRYINIADAENAIRQHIRKHPGLFIFKLNDQIYKD